MHGHPIYYELESGVIMCGECEKELIDELYDHQKLKEVAEIRCLLKTNKSQIIKGNYENIN